MADISRRPLLRHLRCAPTSHIRHLSRGRVKNDGIGVAFWFRQLSAAISEIPVDDRELPLQFRARTADFQEMSVQGALTYRIIDPAIASTRVDFSIDLDTGRWRAAPLEQLGSLLTELAQQHALDAVARLTLAQTLSEGISAVRDTLDRGLAADPRLPATGINIVGVRVVAVRPEPELERALQTPARELVQQEADRATYERRAVAVQRERAIAENELQNQIELAIREEQLVTQRGANERRRAEEAAAASRIESVSEAERRTTLAAADAEATRVTGAAEVETEAARMALARDVDPTVLLALAARDLAGNLPEIGSLTITPDLIAGALQRLTAGSR